MPEKRSDPALSALGEWGFLHRLLPRLGRLGRGRFLVPPGDDAAILSDRRTVLSIDGLTEETHFRLSWAARLKSLTGFSLGRALAWKLIGSAASDLAAMGDTDRRWAMVYLGAPPKTRLSFLEDLHTGTAEAARAFQIALAGGDTVKASQLSLVCAVGARLIARRPLKRVGGRPGDLLCVAGTVGDAAAGLAVLDGKSTGLSAPEKSFFAERFFRHEPQFEAAALLSKERGVSCGLDVSDALSDSVNILCQASGVGARVQIEKIPVSRAFDRRFTRLQALSGGEDYALLFAASQSAVHRLGRRLDFSVIGELLPKRSGVRYQFHGLATKPSRPFGHFE